MLGRRTATVSAPSLAVLGNRRFDQVHDFRAAAFAEELLRQADSQSGQRPFH
jgi:hypothetical protein